MHFTTVLMSIMLPSAIGRSCTLLYALSGTPGRDRDAGQGPGHRAGTGTLGMDRDTGQGQGCHIHVLPAGPQPRQSQRLEMQGSTKGKGRVPMGTESAETSKLKKERSSKVCSQQDYVDMVVWVYCLFPSSMLEGKILLN